MLDARDYEAKDLELLNIYKSADKTVFKFRVDDEVLSEYEDAILNNELKSDSLITKSRSYTKTEAYEFRVIMNNFINLNKSA